MAISILNNIPSLAAQNQLSITQANLQKTLEQLASGSRINSGADDAAGLAIADGLQANVTALTQSAMNANEGVGKLQVADGALSQVTTLLNRAVTLATESANGTVNDGSQREALDSEFQSIKAEIDRIGTNTTYNGAAIFQGGSTNDNQVTTAVTNPAGTVQRYHWRHEDQVLGHHAGDACLYHGDLRCLHRRHHGWRSDQRHQWFRQRPYRHSGQHRQRGRDRYSESR